ncbi:hypothetical protein Acsp05_35530 [Actinokineospora sp. NBRC 105648]|nr:hypothetical protein Acsp05_35530 [Actinokineospora sp. NBRC 105648]
MDRLVPVVLTVPVAPRTPAPLTDPVVQAAPPGPVIPVGTTPRTDRVHKAALAVREDQAALADRVAQVVLVDPVVLTVLVVLVHPRPVDRQRPSRRSRADRAPRSRPAGATAARASARSRWRT